VTRKDIIEWAREISEYLEKHPVRTRTLEERICGLVHTRFSQDELDALIGELEKRIKVYSQNKG
jgi:hypothetical protein